MGVVRFVVSIVAYGRGGYIETIWFLVKELKEVAYYAFPFFSLKLSSNYGLINQIVIFSR